MSTMPRGRHRPEETFPFVKQWRAGLTIPSHRERPSWLPMLDLTSIHENFGPSLQSQQGICKTASGA